MSTIYNVKVKTFADGTRQYMFYSNAREVGYTDDRPRKKKEKSDDKDRQDSLRRSIQTVYDIAKSNIWDWFVTLTFDPQKVNSYDYDACVDAVIRFLKCLRYLSEDFVYLLVPELHKSGRYHFHGLIRGPLPHEEALNLCGRRVLDDNGHQVYNIPIYDYGFTTAIKVYSLSAIGYIAKYITKQDAVPQGRKRYWASRGVARPKVEYFMLDKEAYCEIFNQADYKKLIETVDYGTYELLEIHGKGVAGADGEVNKIKTI